MTRDEADALHVVDVDEVFGETAHRLFVVDAHGDGRRGVAGAGEEHDGNPSREIGDVVFGHDAIEHDQAVDGAGQVEQRRHAGRVILARAAEQQRVAVRRGTRLGATDDDVGIEQARLFDREDVVVERGLHEDETEDPVLATRESTRDGVRYELQLRASRRAPCRASRDERTRES